MNQTHSADCPPIQDEAWLTNQFVSNEFPVNFQEGGQHLNGQSVDVPQQSNHFNYDYTTAPKNFQNNQINDGFLTGAFTNQPQQFNDFVANNSGNQNGTVNGSSSNYNSSDKSSPSYVLNNAILTNNDIDAIKDEINSDPKLNIDESNLSEKEIADRRKAQNRAAQRAFRERKEMKLKELEDKLSKSENDKSQLLKQLEELKKQNVVISTENKLLLQNGNNLVPLNASQNANTESNTSLFSFPSNESPIKCEEESYLKKPMSFNTFQITPGQLDYSGINLTITQVWEYINEVNEKFEKDYDLDVIMKRIKGLEVCHERGASYPKKIIDALLEQYDREYN